MQENDKYYEEIKELIIDTEATIRVKDYSKNKVTLENNYKIGKLIVEAQGGEERAKYGNQLIKKYSRKLTVELCKKYGARNLRNMRQFYLLFKNEIWHSLNAKLDWSHYKELLVLKNFDAINYYIEISIKQNLTYRALHEKIRSKEYEKLSDSTRQKLIENKKPELVELVKNPIVINNPNNIEVITEKMLQMLIMEDIENFLKQLGSEYYFVGREYPVKIGDRYYKIDLLLYNMEYECYVVVELKVGELKHSHIGQIGLYMNYIDKHKKKITQDKTIGIILCNRNNKLIMEYASNPKIISREYILI